MKNLLITFTEFYTDSNLLTRIFLTALIGTPYIAIGYGIFKYLEFKEFDVQMNIGVICLYTLPSFILWVLTMISLYKISNKTRNK